LHKVRTENRAVVGTRAWWHEAGVKHRTQIFRIALFKVLNHGKDLLTQISRIALLKVLSIPNKGILHFFKNNIF
jgi:hypothetical protein